MVVGWRWYTGAGAGHAHQTTVRLGDVGVVGQGWG